jgi:flagellar hook-associated protein 1 FlgK
MPGLFGILSMAGQSLQTQQTGVEVTGQNLANVNTPGYTRQTADIEASPDVTVPGIGLEGTGAQVLTIQQAVDAVLNSQIQGQQSVNGYWNAQQSALQSVQDNLDEFLSTSNSAATNTSTSTTTSSGLSTQLNNFFNDLQSVATSPTSIPARQSLINDAQTLATTFNQMSSQFGQQDTALNTTLSNDVDSANQLLSEIAGLNQQISASEFSGGDANDLIDDQQQDLQNLAQLTDITTSAGTNGQVNVSIDGQQLVSGDKLLDTLQTYDPGNGNLLVETATGGAPLTLTGGSMQGTIDARDGTLATLQNSVNTLASTLIAQFNSIYSTGYSLTGTTGATFFSGSDASSIAVNPALANDPSSFQASGSATASGDNSIVLQLANLATTAQSGLAGQTFTGSYTQTVGNFGNALQSANTQVNNQTAVMNMLTTQQQTVSGVSIDEEMTHLLTFQQAYEASAELVTTVNQMLGATLAMTSGA